MKTFVENQQVTRQFNWVHDCIQHNVPRWKIMLAELVRKDKFTEWLIGIIHIDVREVPTIHKGFATSTMTSVYLNGKAIGEFKQFINASTKK